MAPTGAGAGVGVSVSVGKTDGELVGTVKIGGVRPGVGVLSEIRGCDAVIVPG
jgi:hypothetical protein